MGASLAKVLLSNREQVAASFSAYVSLDQKSIFQEKVMSILIADVVVDGVYVAGANQHRRVTNIEDGKVHYDSRSGNSKGAWSFGHAKGIPPSLDSFAAACTSVISKPESK